MSDTLAHLRSASVEQDGRLVDSRGRPTGLRVRNGGHEIIDAKGRAVGTITLAGAIYDSNGLLVAHAARHDV